MQIRPLRIADTYAIRLEPRRDPRGYFLRVYDNALFQKNGLSTAWIQENQAWTEHRWTVRGLHFQRPPFAETKLIRVVHGAILDVFVDLRAGSSTYGQWDAIELSSEGFSLAYVGKGFAHGYCTLTEQTLVTYRVDAPYAPDCEGGVRWDDPAIGIVWPTRQPILSEKDRGLPPLSDVASIAGILPSGR